MAATATTTKRAAGPDRRKMSQNNSDNNTVKTVNGVDHGQRRKVIVEQLLADIVQGSIQAGERLVITNLAARFGVSQSPIREALVTLEGIGIVDIEANRGAVVRQVTETEVREICQVRQALECAAVRLSCGRIDLAELNKLAEAFRKDSEKRSPSARRPGPAAVRKRIETARELDSRLHDLIAESCGNQFLTRELGRLKLLFRSFRDVAWAQRSTESDLARFEEEAREHLAIVEALLEADAKAGVTGTGKAYSHGRQVLEWRPGTVVCD